MEIFLEVCSNLAKGFVPSFLLFALTLILALPLGLLMSLCTMSKHSVIRVPIKLIVWVLRGTPLLLQIFAFIYLPGLLDLFKWPHINTGWTWFDTTFSARFITVIVAFAINYAAYFSEIFRGGIESISKGQYEAGQVLGLTKSQVFFKIVLLQVVKRIIPPMSNETITLIKDTALANTVGILELMYQGKEYLRVGNIWPFFMAGAFYLIFVGVLTIIFGKFEKKLDYFKA